MSLNFDFFFKFFSVLLYVVLLDFTIFSPFQEEEIPAELKVEGCLIIHLSTMHESEKFHH